MITPTNGSSYLRLLLYVVDSFAIVAFLWALLRMYGVDTSNPYKYYVYLSQFTAIYCFLMFSAFSVYRSWYSLNIYREFVLITKVWSTSVGITLFMFFALKVSECYSRVAVVVWFAMTPLLIFLLHVTARYAIRFIRKKGMETSKAVIVGANETAKSIVSAIEISPWTEIEVVGFFDDEQNGEAYSIPIIGPLAILPDYLKTNPTDYVYIALPMREEPKIQQILSSCRMLGAELFLIPSLQFLNIYCSEVQLYGDLILLSFTPRHHAKRMFDIAFSLFTLLTFLPFGLIIAILIKIEDGGPIFYGHRRVTMAGKPFTCWKFRTMVVDADRKLAEILQNDEIARSEWERTFKLRNDPRITWVGKFLRRMSLDEFPQFYNVLKGDMSTVGARPIIEDELSKYYKENAILYCSTKPGITGPWQAGERSNIVEYNERVKVDIWYILNHSIWLDLKIIIKTVISVLARRGSC